MNEEFFDELIDCLKNSKNVKRKYKRMFTPPSTCSLLNYWKAY